MFCKGIRQSNYAPLYINSSEFKESAMCRLLKNKMYRPVKRHDVVLSLNTEGTTPINDSTECPTKRLNNYAAPLKRKPMFCAVFTWTTKRCALLRDKDVDKQLRRYVYCPSKRQKNRRCTRIHHHECFGFIFDFSAKTCQRDRIERTCSMYTRTLPERQRCFAPKTSRFSFS